MAKDMSRAAFERELARRGLVSQGFMGYYRKPPLTVQISAWNAGTNRRAQLAYLVREFERIEDAAR